MILISKTSQIVLALTLLFATITRNENPKIWGSSCFSDGSHIYRYATKLPKVIFQMSCFVSEIYYWEIKNLRNVSRNVWNLIKFSHLILMNKTSQFYLAKCSMSEKILRKFSDACFRLMEKIKHFKKFSLNLSRILITFQCSFYNNLAKFTSCLNNLKINCQ